MRAVLDDAAVIEHQMRSSRCTVDRRCATTIVVRPADNCSIAARIWNSDTESSEEVASSSTRIGVVGENGAGDGHALALAARELHAALADQSLIGVGQTLDEDIGMGEARGLGDLVSAPPRAGHRRYSRRADDGTGSAPARRCRSPAAATPASPAAMSRPSTRMRPASRSNWRCSSLTKVVLPAPEAPTRPMRSPGRIVSEKFS